MKTLLVFLLPLMSFSLHSQSIKVMSYNIRLDVASDGVNQWSNRTEKLPALIQKYDPDLIGLQEAMHHQLMGILKSLPQYGYIGVARDDGKEKGEYSAILYRKDRFEVLWQKTTWLSETPDVPGSKSWDAAITRVLTRGQFKDKKTNKEFLYYNTHFDHIGKEARKNSAMIIIKTIKEENKNNIPVVVTGDFNSQTSEDPYRTIATSNVVVDARPENTTQGTFCTFSVSGPPCVLIDYIFHSKNVKRKDYKVITDNDGTNYPSDHLPVQAELTFD
ncbi:MAG TPA: endonuclease/exonuclease/phosphatase family protein [Cyclobacteriaceae bacterium]|nr:endonuclease/exonuclease/phosphatase family protein [Cyclobacteriaceae bacterium]